ncbi:hypothetical protein BWI15_16830 [Kribbella sp. ALI-6-A]|uniref:hypothetical protein n=1 Tax=Kribbella sp. ALI-6-A TaxID=1933817 RepID=UPI00097C3336|nr:hypothetical protein [Kribbella sp. ALI-6-A]ONI71798.1 hypothetical protein BWI15_16830 [Kribbella sp. ALI-6-A]
MSNQSDYDRRVKDILDRVAQGHLSSDEAATLIAALAPTAPVADQAATNQPSTGTASSQPSAGTATSRPSAGAATDQPSAGTANREPAGDDVPSASVWAEVVDSPDAADAVPGPKPAAGGETQERPASAPSGSVPTSSTAGGSVPTGSAAGGSGPTGSAAGVSGAATGNDQTGGGSGVQDSVVDEAPAGEAEEEEVEHSNVPVPSGVRRVTIRAVGRRVRLIGESAITGVAVDGPHVIKRDGDTLSINSEGDMGVSLDGFSMLRNPTDLKAHVNGFARELSIRVNPMLEVEVEVTGGSVAAERLPGLTRVRVTAGTAKVTDVDGPIDLLVQAGSAHLDAQITKGRSRVRVESGAATVNLRRGSDVRVHTESQLGRVTWAGAVNGHSKDVEIGRGRAALDVEVLVGTAQITSD